MLTQFCVRFLLLTDKHPSIWRKLKYWIEITPVLSGFGYLFDGVDLWFKTNKQFVTFVIIAVIINIVYGMYYHHKTNTFDYGQLLRKASKMVVTIIVSYVLLDMLRVTSGENIAGEIFKVVIQIMTLVWPISKTLKQVYILNNKEFPPEFIMEKLYNFEKTGNVAELFNTNQKDQTQ